MNARAIETIYDGYRFRSRLEARWAVFFNTLGIEYQYEKEGYDLDGAWYLPDFWLPQYEYFIEIKGQNPTEDELQKAYKLALATKKPVFVFGGDCWYETKAYVFYFIGDEYHHIRNMALKAKRHKFLMSEGYPPLLHGTWISDHEYWFFNPHVEEDQQGDGLFLFRGGVNLEDKLFWAYPSQWLECEKCHKFGFAWERNLPCDCPSDNVLRKKNTETPRLIAAYTAARQARFEHGDTPTP
jgi:hypothetical protein